MTLKIGSDPEFFLKKGSEFLSAHEMVPGSKANPYPVPNGAVQVDGMALEFNIDPAMDASAFVHNINTVLGSLRSMVPKDFDFAFEAVARFPPAYFKEQPDEAKVLGCEPDYDAYTGTFNTPPDNRKPMRTAAGHIHLGWNEDGEPVDFQKMEEAKAVVKQLDFALGVPSIVADQDGAPRRQMYGKAGCFRPKTYGAEYRVLSNFWLKTDELKEWVFNTTQHAFSLLTEDGVNLNSLYHDRAKRIINKGSSAAASAFIKYNLRDYGIEVPR
jgi:hypothetical protein